MIWFVLLVISIVLALIGFLRTGEVDSDACAVPAIIAVILAIVCAIGQGCIYNESLDAQKDYARMPLLVQQRDGLVDLVKNEMSNDNFKALMSLDDSAQVSIMFNTSTGASNVLISRATALVDLNKQVLDAVKAGRSHTIDVCADNANPWFPQIPFVPPSCKTDFGSLDPVSVGVYDGVPITKP